MFFFFNFSTNSMETIILCYEKYPACDRILSVLIRRASLGCAGTSASIDYLRVIVRQLRIIRQKYTRYVPCTRRYDYNLQEMIFPGSLLSLPHVPQWKTYDFAFASWSPPLFLCVYRPHGCYCNDG